MHTCRFVLWPAIALGLGVSSLAHAQQDDGIPGESYHWQLQVRGLYVIPTNEHRPLSVNLDGGAAGEVAAEWLFMPRWSAELAVSTPADLRQRGAQGSLRLRTETLTAKYYLPEAAVGGLIPYLGVGLYDASVSRSGTAPNVGFSSPGVNVVLQAGFTYTIASNAFASADVRYLNNLEPGLSVDGGNSGHLGVDPLVFGLGVGVRF